MIFGAMAGRILRDTGKLTGRLKRLVLLGIAGLVLGQVIGALGWCPIVKRIWCAAFRRPGRCGLCSDGK